MKKKEERKNLGWIEEERRGTRKICEVNRFTNVKRNKEGLASRERQRNQKKETRRMSNWRLSAAPLRGKEEKKISKD